jgi:hypothetical protein
MHLNPDSKLPSPARLLLRQPLALESETSWFLLLGVLDLVLTTLLLHSGRAHESNPLARFALLTGGLRGLIGYKCGLLALVAVAAQFITLRNPKTARTVLTVGIVGQLIVVSYSVALLLKLLA